MNEVNDLRDTDERIQMAAWSFLGFPAMGVVALIIQGGALAVLGVGLMVGMLYMLRDHKSLRTVFKIEVGVVALYCLFQQ